MKLIGTALQHVNDVAAVDVAITGRRICRNDMNFRERIRRRVIADEVILPLVDVDPVKGVIIRLRAISIDRHDATVIGIALQRIPACQALRVGSDRAWLKEGQRREIAPVERDRGDLLL